MLSKSDHIRALLSDPKTSSLSNAAIAAQVGCDEGLARKARPLVRVELLEEENARLKKELEEAEKDLDELSDQIDKVDVAIGDALESVGKFPGKPAGFWDRIDVLIAHVTESAKELARYRRATPRPKRQALDREFAPLWERIGEDGSIIPTVPILEIHA